jgi:hypothetical protein
LSSSPNSLFSKMNADLEGARKRLHKFIDDYVDSVRNDLVRRFKGDVGDQGNISKLIQEIKTMVIQLRLKEKQLYSNQILNSIKQIIQIDQDNYIRELRNKLGMIQNEQTCIDLVVDDDELFELLTVLQRIIQVGKKNVKNFEGLDEVNQI